MSQHKSRLIKPASVVPVFCCPAVWIVASVFHFYLTGVAPVWSNRSPLASKKHSPTGTTGSFLESLRSLCRKSQRISSFCNSQTSLEATSLPRTEPLTAPFFLILTLSLSFGRSPQTCRHLWKYWIAAQLFLIILFLFLLLFLLSLISSYKMRGIYSMSIWVSMIVYYHLFFFVCNIILVYMLTAKTVLHVRVKDIIMEGFVLRAPALHLEIGHLLLFL